MVYNLLNLYFIIYLTTPSIGEDAEAYSFFGILPAKKASLPDSTANFIAFAILIGSLARATPVFNKTPSAPNSIAIVASEAVPTPASTITGTFAFSRIIFMLLGFKIPWPDPIGAPNGITAAAPDSSNFF